MCIAAFALDVGRYSAVIISNRDEWLHRPAQAMSWWPDSEVLAGKDLSAGGTWLGLNRAGKFALVTNIRGSSLDEKPYALSRGTLPLAWLNIAQRASDFVTALQQSVADYAGYNIIFGDLKTLELTHFNNRERVVTGLGRNRVHGLSNGSLDTPWPKLVRLKASLEHTLAFEGDANPQSVKRELFAALSDRVNLEGSPLSAINVEATDFHGTGNTYGRRCSTVVMVHRDGEINVEETQREGGSQRFRWQL
jgi:uncharacterized protein with NRDE domain